MAFNPGKYVFEPRPLQQFDFGQGFRDLIEARFGKRRADLGDAQLVEQRQGREDMNTRFAAELASARNKEEYEKILAKYQQGVDAANAGRTAWANGNFGGVEAMSPRIRETGGSVERIPSARPGGLPSYDIRAPERPEAPALDIPGMRRQIFGGNPMDPPATPGISAAALPQPAAAPPPAAARPAPPYPGREGMQPPTGSPPPPDPTQSPPPVNTSTAPPLPRPGEAAAAGIDAINAATSELAGGSAPAPEAPPDATAVTPPGEQAQQPDSLQLTPPNPYNAPAFSPYRLDTDQLLAQNRARLNPYLEGFQKGVPAEYQGRLNAFNQAVGGLGLPPGETLKLAQPALGQLVSLMRSDINSENASASLGLRGQAMQNSRNERLMRNAQTRTEVIGKKFKLTENIDRWNTIDEAKGMLGMRTSQADTQAISLIRDLIQTGIMTNADFDNVRSGPARTLVQKIKDGTWEMFLQNGINPDARRALFEIIEASKASSMRRIRQAQSQMLQTVRNPRTSSAEERDYYLNSIAQSVPEELWDPLVREAMGVPLDQKSGPMDQSGNFAVSPPSGAPAAPRAPTGGNDLGVVPLPSTGKSGTVKTSASRKSAAAGKKSLDQMTEEEINKLPTEELERLLSEVPQ